MNHESPVYKDIQKSNNSGTFSTAAVHSGNFSLWPPECKHLHWYRDSICDEKTYIGTFPIFRNI